MNSELIVKAKALADGLDAVTATGPVSACLRDLALQHERLGATLNEWFEKTDWVQASFSPSELGQHRADVLRHRIEELEKERLRLCREVVGRNQRALDGDRATAAINRVFDSLEKCEAECHRLQKEVGQLKAEPKPEQPAQQKPIAEVVADEDGYAFIKWHDHEPTFYDDHPIGTKFYTSPPPQRKPLTDEQREHLRDAFAQSLTSVYVCGRVWEAWQYGTMSEGDFQPAGECEEVLDALIEAAHGITAQPEQHPDTARLDWLARNPLAALDIFGCVKTERDAQDVRKDIDNAIHQQGT